MLLQTIKQMNCHHDFRFVKYLHGDGEGKFEYQCTQCGKREWFDRPIDCCGCKHLYTDEGGAHCDVPYERTCLKTRRLWWEEDLMYNLEELKKYVVYSLYLAQRAEGSTTEICLLIGQALDKIHEIEKKI